MQPHFRLFQDGWAATQETVTPTETPEKLEPAAKRPKSKTYDITLKIAPPGKYILIVISFVANIFTQ